MAKVWQCDGPTCGKTVPEDRNLTWWWVEAPVTIKTIKNTGGEGCYCSPQCIVKAFTRMTDG